MDNYIWATLMAHKVTLLDAGRNDKSQSKPSEATCLGKEATGAVSVWVRQPFVCPPAVFTPRAETRVYVSAEH